MWLTPLSHRLAACKLELNENKTSIVYCKDPKRKGKHEHFKFDFLGHTFMPRQMQNKQGKRFLGFLPAISTKTSKRIGETIRTWWIAKRTDKTLKEIVYWINPYLQGWINYYGKFYKSELYKSLYRVNLRLTICVIKKFKRFRGQIKSTVNWLGEIYKSTPNLFARWIIGLKPPHVKLGTTG